MKDNIEKIKYQDKDIYLVKTAHVSKLSVNDVNEIIDEVQPDSICIELDKDRLESLTKKDAWRDTDINQIIKQKRVGFLMVNVILSSFQRRLAKQMDTTTGGEMLAGINKAKELNCDLVLADRNIKTTFSRIWSNLGFIEKTKLLTTIVMSIFDDEEISEEEIANLKQTDILESALNEVGKNFPIMKRILVDERDMYLTEKIRTAKGNKIVAIVGAAHSLGIKKHINDEKIDLNELNNVNKKKGLSSIIKWLIPLGIIAIIAYTTFINLEAGLNQMLAWILWNGTLSAIGVMIALGHPLTILTAFIMAPITSLSPLIAAGWFAGLTEAYIRKPKVKDFEDIAEDTSSLKGFWKNRVTRILLVVILANVFSSIGTFIGGVDIIKSFLNIL